MKYTYFLLKKIRKDKINVIPFLLITVFIILIYVGNHRSAYLNINNPMFSGENEVAVLKEDVTRFEAELHSFDLASEDYKISNENLHMAKTRLNFMQNKLAAMENKDWNEYYRNDAKLMEITIDVLEESIGYNDKESIDSLKQSIQYNQYMAEHNLGFDNRFTNIQGVSYTIHVMNDFTSIMLAVFLIFITSKMFCSSYFENFDIQDVLPYSHLKKEWIKLCSGMLVAMCIVFFISMISLLCGTLGNTFGSLSSPVLTYNQGMSEYSSFLSLFPQVIVLMILSIVFIVNFVSLVSKITRRNMPCLLVSLVVIMGFLIILQDLAPLQAYLHMIPTTYLNAQKVISGELAKTSYNVLINFTNGVITLLISNFILFILNYYLPKVKFWRGK